MVLMVTKFKCEICKREYNDYTDACNCEKNGIENPILEIGQEVYRDQKITGFDLFHRTIYRVFNIYINGHECIYELEEYNPDEEQFDEYCGFNIDGNEDLLNDFVIE